MENKRGLKRYDCQTECEIRVGNDFYKGYIMDYSDGLGVVVEKAPLLKLGVEADIWIPESYEEINVQVAWVREMDNYVKIGFQRVGNLTGTLKAFKLADLLIGFQRGTKTGILEIVSGSTVKMIYIKNGDMIFARSNVNDDRLGEWLVKKGRISIEHFNLASERLHETGEKLGKILVDMSCMIPRELYHEVRAQVEDIILSLFAIEEGDFEFKEGPLPTSELVTLSISAANIIYRGMKLVKSLTYIKQMCPLPDSVMEVSQNPIDMFQNISLSQKDKQILNSINGRDSLDKILKISPTSDFDTLKTISAFLSIGIINIQNENKAHATISVSDILQNLADETPEEFLTKMEESFTKCESADYYDFFGVDHDATEEEIQRAYYRISKQFHPDRHFSYPALDIKAKLIKIFTYATDGNNILLDSGKRVKYDKGLLMKAQNISTGEESAHDFDESTNPYKKVPIQKYGVSDINIVIKDIQDGNGQESKDDSESPYDLGVAYTEMGLMDDAIREFRIASNDSSKRIKCSKAIAECYINQGNYQHAIEELNIILSELSPDDIDYLDIRKKLADMYVKNSEYDNAIKLLSKNQQQDAR